MPPQKKRTGKRRTKKAAKGFGPVARLSLAGFLLAAVVLVCFLLLRQPPPPAPPVSLPPEAPVLVDPQVFLEDLQVELESFLLRGGYSPGQIRRLPSEGMVDLEIRGTSPDPGLMETLQGRIERLAPDIRLEQVAGRGELRIFQSVALVGRLRFKPPPVIAPVRPQARMAIIMDDLGRDLKTARKLLAVDLPVTFAVLPATPHATEVAKMAFRSGREVLVHMPMEPQGFPAINPGSDALLVSQGPEEIRSRFLGYLDRVPHAVGGNNHMGSRFTENAEGMAVVLGVMKERGMFFVDSVTTGRSVGFRLARAEGMGAAERDLFLDNVQEVAAIRAEIRRLASLARRQRQAVGICHPYPETLEALRLEAQALKESGVEVVPVSALLDRS